MEFLTTYYRQQGAKSVSLLLQQYAYRGEQVCFACLCKVDGTRERDLQDVSKMQGMEMAGGYVTGQLLNWFRGLNVKKLLRQKEDALEKLADKLREKILQMDGELWQSGLLDKNQTVSFGGILCLGDFFLLVHRGNIEGILVNTALGRGHEECMWEEATVLEVEQGMLQPGIGMLFATNTFVESMPREVIRESLRIGEIQSEEQLRARLKALGEEGERHGGVGLSAILLKSRDRIR